MSEHPSGRFVQMDGATLHYADHGRGAALVLIHGGLSSWVDWQPLLPELVEGFRVITPDSRGHGRSTNPSGELSYARIADDTAALIVGAAYPDFDAGGLRAAHRALLGIDETGVPDPALLDADLGEWRGTSRPCIRAGPSSGERSCSGAPGCGSATRALAGIGSMRSRRRSWCSPATGTISSPSTCRSRSTGLPNAELAVCPWLSHDGPAPERAQILASLIRDFARRHAEP
jgi:alpha/beta hydrolase fold